MAKGASSKRYAQAVFDIALEKKELGKWRSELQAMGAVLGDPQLLNLLENPKLPFAEKQKILRSLLTGISPLAMNLTFLLVAKNRLSLLDDIITEYGQLVDANEGRVHVNVTTAVPLEDVERQALQVKLTKALQKEVVIATRVDPAVVGGIVLRIGDKLIDGSLHTRLQDLRKNLIQASVTMDQ